MRVRHKPWAKDYLLTLEMYLPTEELDIEQFLPTKKTKIALEIGMGKGDFLKEMVIKYPDVYFLGVEKNSSVLAVAAEKLLEVDTKNFNITNADALVLLPKVPKESVDYIILNHSDPWPKKRHEKRRLTYKTFMDEYFRVLKKGGYLLIKTDNDGLAEYTYEVISQYPYENIQFIKDYDVTSDFDAKTEYENKFTLKGVKIKRIVGKK
ncbi:MAG: tRNA (guanosine(46)-N7)-methyltransferase TrmB [Bacilli bacterium]|nr:tRNA (guanosine(46)-N7)-methyltransferase TrmB [Bacilli bacterium]